MALKTKTKTPSRAKAPKAKAPKATPCVRRKVGMVMHEFKTGGLKISTSDMPVRNRRQALAIAYSEARRTCSKSKSKSKSGTSTSTKNTAKSKSKSISKECLQRHIKAVMHEMKAGTLRSGRRGHKKRVTNPIQALAMGYARARAECSSKALPP